MQSAWLVMHQSKANVVELAERVAVAFRAEGLRLAAEPWLRQRLGDRAEKLFPAEAGECVVAVGGDGTLLRANQFAVENTLPLLGINVGHIGFLVESELDQLTETARRLRADDYQVESRMMLQCVCGGQRRIALNDVVLTRGGYTRLIAVKAWVGEDMIGRFVADGLIVSSPTGSTGYSLSAGGPIVCPEVKCMLLTPVCAHSLQHRPVVAAETQRVTLELDSEVQAQLEIDGQHAGTLQRGDRVVVSKAAEEARLIRLGGRSFFERIRYKLSEWSC